MDTIFNIETDLRIKDFANYARLPGWYFDTTGCYCCVVNNYLFSIFVNDMDDTLDITVDTISESGYFDLNLEWETPDGNVDMLQTIQRFLKKYLYLENKKVR